MTFGDIDSPAPSARGSSHRASSVVLRASLCFVVLGLAACDGGRRVADPVANGGGQRADGSTRDVEAPSSEAGTDAADSLVDAARADVVSPDAALGDTAQGPDGSADPCAGVTCSGHGRCAVTGGQVLCLCDAPYVPDGLACVVPAPTPPSVTSLLATPTELAPSAQLVLVAEVADPDGAGDIQSGALEDLQGRTLGVFSAVRPGSWRWSGTPADLLSSTTVQIDEVGPLVLVARFYDRAGSQGSAQVTVTLRCPSGQGICGTNACARLDSAAHCGSCALSCTPLGPSYSCNLPSCSGRISPQLGTQSCDDACGLATCLYAEARGTFLALNQPCSAVFPTTLEYDLRITRFSCNCYTQLPVDPPAGMNCREYCASAGGTLGCRRTEFLAEDVARPGATVGFADACQPPYATTPDLSVGTIFHYDFGPPQVTCACRGSPR